MAKTKTTKRIVEDKTFSAQALKAEQGRRRNNRRREAGDKVRPASWVFRGLSNADIEAILEGETITASFQKRDVNVSLAK